MRFWWTKLCAIASAPPSGPSRALSGTHTLSNVILGWSVGMLNVHIYSSTLIPGVPVGTSRQVMPFAFPSAPLVRQKVAQCVATCMPVIHILRPSMRQPSTPSRVSRTPRVSICVASLP